MTARNAKVTGDPTRTALIQRLTEAEATIEALLSGQIDAVVDSKTKTPVLLSKAQDALRESEERYRGIVETANEGIWTIDLDSNVSFVNPRLADMLGYTADEIVGQSLFRFVPDGNRPQVVARFERALQGSSQESEGQLVHKDGSELHVLLKISPIRDTAGTTVGVLAMMTDWTRQRDNELALRKSEEQYRQIVETTTDGIIKIDQVASILFVNRRFAEMLGYEPRDMIGQSVFGFMSAAAKVIAVATLQLREQGQRGSVDISFRHKDGNDVSVNITGAPIFDDRGRYLGTLAMVRDVTEQRKLQSQLMVSDRMASVGTLAAGVAHEINNPLAAVIANIDYIAESLARTVGGDAAAKRSESWFLEEIKAPLDDAREAAQRVRFIVRDLKIFSRSPIDEPRGAVDVKAIMESSVRMAWNEIRHRARLVKTYADVPAVAVNEARLGQVFLNLVVNAAQALPDGRAEDNEIRVTTRRDGDRVVIEVSDTGVGIPPENLGRVFDAFFTTKPVGVGTGLGLAICHRIVTDMGGDLTVTSVVGTGTTFRVAIPIARSEIIEPVASKPVVISGRRGRILVVDDEALIARGIERILCKHHDVVATVSARQALAFCLKKPFDLILCDLMMPDMTGMDLHAELTRLAPDQATKMIFLTGGAFTQNARSFLSETPKEHLEKPFDPANLRAIVQRYLR